MSRDDIIRMAREAGLPAGYDDQLEDFAALVAAAERKACAKVCDERAMRCEYEAQHELDFGGTEADVAGLRSTAWLLHVSAAEIRARSTA